MTFSIQADFPLGVYRGAGSDGRPDRLPSVARLHSALLCAAGFGPRAEPRGDRMGPCAADEIALRWLDENPPDEVTIPAMRVNRGHAVAYREDGTLTSRKGVLRFNKPAKSPDVGTALASGFTWTWTQTPPSEIVAAFAALCPDVPYLGTSESPVRMSTSSEPGLCTHTLDTEASLFDTRRGETVDVPTAGRVAELVSAHWQATERAPSVRDDRYKTSERSAAPVPPRGATAPARYRSRTEVDADVPWPEVFLFPIDRTVGERQKVAWAVAAHRALIATIGDGAPALLTGTYPAGQARPTNRIALHILDPHEALDLQGHPAALALMVPRHAAARDVQVVLEAAAELPSFRKNRQEVRRVLGEPWAAPGARLWTEPAPGMVRTWCTAVPAVPDTRGAGAHWTFAHAALLSMAFVWRGSVHLPDVGGRGDSRYRELAMAAIDAGVVVLDAFPLRDSGIHDYVHRVNEHAVVRPYGAWLSTGALGGDTCLQAFGQTRHLGGGLLVPRDLPGADLLNPGAGQ